MSSHPSRRGNASLTMFLNGARAKREAQLMTQVIEEAPHNIKERIAKIAAQIEAKTTHQKVK